MTWQTYYVPERHESSEIVRDLDRCRHRGLDWLDRRTANQRPIECPALQELAEDYVAARHLVAAGRIAQIKLLIRQCIDEFARQDYPSEAMLMRDLFFGESSHEPIKPPGALLKRAKDRSGDTASRFQERRRYATESFAQFLIGFVDSTGSVDDETERGTTPPETPSDQGAAHDSTGADGPLIGLGHVDTNERFLQMLAGAARATIIGITNEGLLAMLEEALRRKRSDEKGAFWDSLRIVFLGNDLLGYVNDEREAMRDSREALRQRSLESAWAYRSLGAFLKRTESPTHWSLHKCRYIPPVTGSYFEFADGRKVADIVVRRAQRPIEDTFHIELEDRADQISDIFEDIIYHSESNYNVPVGAPSDGVFRCDGMRLHSNVLKDGSDSSGWLPMVLVITSRRRVSQIEPILQLRTAMNSARELNRLSHLGGHILQEDCEPDEHDRPAGHWSFGLDHEIPTRAARRIIREVTGMDAGLEPRPLDTGSYLYPDKEHLYFFVFSLELPERTQMPRRAEMHPFRLHDLVKIRGNQVLRAAVGLCQAPDISSRTWSLAAEIVALNLALHDHADLGDTLIRLAGRDASARLHTAAQISSFIVEQPTPTWAPANTEIQLLGLAGWQYREFFSILLPQYEQIGITDAVEILNLVRADPQKSSAVARLRDLYQDEQLMAHMPIEL